MPKLGRMIFKSKGRDVVERFLLSMEKQYMAEHRGEEALWTSTIRKAWSDAFYDVKLGTSHPSESNMRTVKREARRFLMEGGNWAAGREGYCELAEISPEWISDQAKKALNNGPPQPIPPGTTMMEPIPFFRRYKKGKKPSNPCKIYAEVGE